MPLANVFPLPFNILCSYSCLAFAPTRTTAPSASFQVENHYELAYRLTVLILTVLILTVLIFPYDSHVLLDYI